MIKGRSRRGTERRGCVAHKLPPAIHNKTRCTLDNDEAGHMTALSSPSSTFHCAAGAPWPSRLHSLLRGSGTSFSVLPELRCDGPFGRETALKHGFRISPSLLLPPSSPIPSQSSESITPVNGVASFLSLQRHRGPQAARPCPAWHSG